MSKVLFLIVVLFPSILFAQDVAPEVVEVVADPTGLVAMIEAAPWYGVAVMVVGAMKFITPLISDTFMDKYPVLKQLNIVLNWISLNVLGDKNKK